MRTSRLLFLLPLAACCAAAWAVPQAAHQGAGQEGMIVVRDPQTGQMRPPTAAELQALQRAAPASRLAPVQPKMVLGADGRRSVQLGDSGLVYSVVKRDAEGKLDRHCVHGEAAAERAVRGHQSAVPQEDHHHESR
ncbi:post-PEP-CTERM-1 domain-containing protein [Massilia sp. ST3]|uniref:post-PEP-CTERM-1 domain-containing protein n=1 Tax=Massilia sp. ST3 TaxID=2824903 RepID=UPI001B8168E0|nr:hypothetical protein [Massilia sp. ST3]MBQ5949519.1 hypothetical protein [Massilia sp. ST3]